MKYLLILIIVIVNFSSCQQDHSIQYDSTPLSKGDYRKRLFRNKHEIYMQVRNAFYSVDQKPQHAFDLYRPRNASQKLPLVLLLHSGGFFSGSKDNYIITQYARDLSKTGRFACASINYRVFDFKGKKSFRDYTSLVSQSYINRTIMEAVSDVRMAIQYFKRNAEDYNIDPTQIYIVGFSAGGVIAHHMVYSGDEEWSQFMHKNKFDDVMDRLNVGITGRSLFRNNLDLTQIEKDDVKAVVSINGGILDYTHLLNEDSSKIPFLALHSSSDEVLSQGYDYPFTKYTPNQKFPIASLYYDLGVSNSQEIEIGVKVPEKWMRSMIKLYTFKICGSGCVADRLYSDSYVFEQIQHAPHIFMLNPDGRFTKSYQKSLERVYSFFMRNR